ncbi:hypothetical protein BDA96_10G264200 [Sorghum bicolor]|uniref:Secreted protein n=2 Tax=Sorghum bicolor TaxID=4558 RepID=A0A921U269_SORBI|nr:hypothetical protein BDA96_10G264200 [Sorghum bicolor]KXG20458.1 hypothetical protein SORBI_3010G203000 [Sorghum bicolor]
MILGMFYFTVLLALGRSATPSLPPAPHGKKEKKEKKTRPSPTNSPYPLVLHGGPPFVHSLRKEPTPTPTSTGSTPPLALSVPSTSVCR